MKEYPRIIFFGTPEIAVASLAKLVDAGFPVAGVVTSPDKPAGRGLKLKSSPVKEYAISQNLLLLQPDNLKDPFFIEQLRSLKPEIQVVVAFRILPREVWSLPAKGTFNLHASILPQYRGAAPINWAIINGENETGITTFLIEESLDTGKILFTEKTTIGPDETAGELHDRLMVMGAEMVLRTAEAIHTGNVRGVSQETMIHSLIPLKRAPKIRKEDCCIDWARDTLKVHNFIRGLSPWPGAYTELVNKNGNTVYMKIFRASPEYIDHLHRSGQIFTDGKTFFKIATINGYMHLVEIQLAGRKPMIQEEFLRGFGRQFS